jgi:hypothetical protein
MIVSSLPSTKALAIGRLKPGASTFQNILLINVTPPVIDWLIVDKPVAMATFQVYNFLMVWNAFIFASSKMQLQPNVPHFGLTEILSKLVWQLSSGPKIW